MKKEQDIKPINKQDILTLAWLYGKVFAGSPWNEVSKCPNCGSFSGSQPESQDNCECGGTFSLPAYPLQETVQYIGSEFKKVGARGRKSVISNGLSITGFAWGYRAIAESFSEDKYRTPEMQATIQDLLGEAGPFFYLSEAGIDPRYQGQRLGTRLTSSLIDATVNKRRTQTPINTFVLRTNENSPARKIAEKLGMTPILGLNSGVRDTENGMRVIFIGRK